MGEIGSRAHPFRTKPLHRVGLLHRVLGRLPRQNALVELTNALAGSRRVLEVPAGLVATLSAKYRVDVQKAFQRELRALYRGFMTYCLRDRKFNQDEADDLVHLQAMFGFPDRVHRRLYEEVAQQTYQRTVRDVLADGEVTGEEKALLKRLGKDVRLPDDVMRGIYEAETARFVQGKLDKAIEDRMLSPDEEEELRTLARNLGCRITTDAGTEATLDRCRLMWRIAHGDPPRVSVPLALQRGEVCYFRTPATWHEMRRQMKRIRYAGPAVRLKICKGLYWRMGDFAIQPVSQDVLAPIDEGTAYVTSKRLLFRGRMKNTSIRLAKILDVTPYTDGVMIEKDAGKSPFLGFTENVDIFCACLARAIRDTG